MNIRFHRFASVLTLMLLPGAVCAEDTLVPEWLPYENGSITNITGYKSPAVIVPEWLPYENGSLDHIDGYKAPPGIVLPGGDPTDGTTGQFDYKSTVPPEPEYNPPFAAANFLANVADARGRTFGTLKLNVSARRAFTSVLRIGKKTYPFRGTLDSSGSFSRVLTPRGAMRVAVSIQVSNGRMVATVTKGTVILSAQ